MELLKDSMKEVNSDMVSDVEELGPPLSWCGISGVGGLAFGATFAPSAPPTTGRFSP
jgi:hypothetical protein